MINSDNIETDPETLKALYWDEEDLEHVENALHLCIPSIGATAMPGLEQVRNKIAVRVGKPVLPEGSFAKNG